MVIVLSDYDSRIKWGAALGLSICKSLGLSHDKLILYYKAASPEIFERYEIKAKNRIIYPSLELLLSSEDFLEESDILILAVGGPDNFRVLSFCNTLNQRPICITGFNGVIDSQDPHGLLCRYGADYICMNNKNDLENSRSILSKLELSSECLVLTGYLRHFCKYEYSISHTKEERNWLFIEQIGIPNTFFRMTYLFKSLVLLAEENQGVNLIIKCRAKRKIANVNSKKRRDVDLLDIWGVLKHMAPQNLIVDNSRTVEELVSQSELCIAFSSTVLLEALALKKNVAVLTDFGIDKKIGNYVFLGSGLLVSLKQIEDPYTRRVDGEWMRSNCAFNEVEELMISLKRKYSKKDKLAKLELFYTEKDFPFFFQKLEKNWRAKILLRMKKCLN